MFRTLILFIAIGVAIWLFSRMIKNKTAQSGPKKNGGQNTEIKSIVQCHSCHVFVPEDKAIQQGQFSFCSQKHLDEWNENN